MTGGITALFRANGVAGFQATAGCCPEQGAGHGRRGRETILQAKHVVLASGSAPVRIKDVPHDGNRIVDSWNALEFDACRALGVIVPA